MSWLMPNLLQTQSVRQKGDCVIVIPKAITLTDLLDEERYCRAYYYNRYNARFLFIFRFFLAI